MPHDGAVSGGDAGTATIEIRKGKALPPGPGNFDSNGKEWAAAMTPVTTQQRDPINPERWIDVPVTDAEGNVLMRPNPAAMDTIKRSVGEGAKALPVAAAPEPKNLHKEQMDSLIALQRSTMEAQAQSAARQDKLIDLLAQVVAGKSANV